jgi:putative spermidine/putrescine transport system substrate-binding protein
MTLAFGVISSTTADAAPKPKPKFKAPKVATSAAEVGGMAALIKAAKKEGELNVIALPHDWANYGELISTFATKYGIKVNEQNPDGSSADEINAVIALKGQNRQPDVVDVGLQFAVQGAEQGLFAPYKVAKWKDLPATAKDPAGKWFLDYGGFIAIGYNAKLVSPAPTSIKSLLNPAYKNQVALNGDPTKANAAFSAVFAAAIANGGSVNDVSAGLSFFSDLKKAGNFIPVEATPATVQSGQTPITLDWDYLQAKYKDEASGKVDWRVVVPSDAQYGGFYAQAIVKNSPPVAGVPLQRRRPEPVAQGWRPSDSPRRDGEGRHREQDVPGQPAGSPGRCQADVRIARPDPARQGCRGAGLVEDLTCRLRRRPPSRLGFAPAARCVVAAHCASSVMSSA